MERVPAKTLCHRCNMAITRLVVKDVSSGSSLDRVNFVYVLMPVWIPYTGRVFEFRPYKSKLNLNGFLLQMLRSQHMYILRQLFFPILANSGRTFTLISKNNY